jgi:hypothetical protein
MNMWNMDKYGFSHTGDFDYPNPTVKVVGGVPLLIYSMIMRPLN